jgi:murein DD-endopeptidase MepM/ murein hydrolase activator NlpD
VKTRYGHLSEVLVKLGDRVKRGEKVAGVGNTGKSTGPHLHYEVRVNGIPENPRKFILE